MYQQYEYGDVLAASQKINWRIEDLIGEDKPLDFDKPFLPESLARVEPLAFLDSDEKLALSQIRGNGYLYIFGLVEEFILPFVIDHARPTLAEDDVRTRAFLQFASEEAKHIHLFKRFREEFEAGFGVRCDVIGPPQEIGKAVLAHDPLSVALLILHIEWMTQSHYLDSVKEDHDLDPQFKSLLKHHWMEESQHAKLDTLMVEGLAASRSAEAVEKAIDGYVQLGGMIDGGLQQQATFDLANFVRATGRCLDSAQQQEFVRQQHQAQRWTYIGSGMTHPKFLATLRNLSPERATQIMQLAPAFS